VILLIEGRCVSCGWWDVARDGSWDGFGDAKMVQTLISTRIHHLAVTAVVYLSCTDEAMASLRNVLSFEDCDRRVGFVGCGWILRLARRMTSRDVKMR